jgi:hypothetical protein
MRQIPNLIAVFQDGSSSTVRYDVFKTDGDLSEANHHDNRYVYIDGQLRLIAAIWDKKFLGFQSSSKSL